MGLCIEYIWSLTFFNMPFNSMLGDLMLGNARNFDFNQGQALRQMSGTQDEGGYVYIGH